MPKHQLEAVQTAHSLCPSSGLSKNLFRTPSHRRSPVLGRRQWLATRH